MLARLRQLGQDLEKREIALTIFTGLVVAYVRHGLQHHWKAWDSIGDFFAAWFVHTMGVAVLMGVTLAAIIYSHKFFLGYDREHYGREITFYIVVTILVTALGIAFVAHSPPSDEYDDSSAFVSFYS
jgi:MFS superfamily sulfate permease-like transporter